MIPTKVQKSFGKFTVGNVTDRRCVLNDGETKTILRFIGTGLKDLTLQCS